MEFELNGSEYIELNKLLKIMQVCSSGGEAKLFIKDGLIMVNGEVELQLRKKLRSGDLVNVDNQVEILIK